MGRTTNTERAIIRRLNLYGFGDWVSFNRLRKQLQANYRSYFDRAVFDLVQLEIVEVRDIIYHGNPGHQIRLIDPEFYKHGTGGTPYPPRGVFSHSGEK